MTAKPVSNQIVSYEKCMRVRLLSLFSRISCSSRKDTKLPEHEFKTHTSNSFNKLRETYLY